MITSQTLTALYGTPVEVVHTPGGQLVVVGQPEAPARHTDRHAACLVSSLILAGAARATAQGPAAATGLTWNIPNDLRHRPGHRLARFCRRVWHSRWPVSRLARWMRWAAARSSLVR